MNIKMSVNAYNTWNELKEKYISEAEDIDSKKKYSFEPEKQIGKVFFKKSFGKWRIEIKIEKIENEKLVLTPYLINFKTKVVKSGQSSIKVTKSQKDRGFENITFDINCLFNDDEVSTYSVKQELPIYSGSINLWKDTDFSFQQATTSYRHSFEPIFKEDSIKYHQDLSRSLDPKGKGRILQIF